MGLCPTSHQAPAGPGPARLRVRVTGAVQGVGFRPFVYGVAQRLGLGGFVYNDAAGVVAEFEGIEPERAIAALRDQAPALARVEQVAVEVLAPIGDIAFTIQPSRGGVVATHIPADAAICPECLADLHDPGSRFYRYPFVNCTQCGPRYTLTRALPYDRAQTSMAGFTLCPDCAQDYADPTSRRFHAEPIACPRCGPRLSHAIGDIQKILRDGGIVALKSLGGFHLLCDARNDRAVAELRRRKQRSAKPFAIMAASLVPLAAVAIITEAEAALLSGAERPVVLVQRRAGDDLARSVAPGLNRIGALLAYTPLHHLLFSGWDDGLLVATSANPGGEPLVIGDDEAHQRLTGIADLIVTHDRAILTRCDDSVAQILDGAPMLLRRARGYVPQPIKLPHAVPPVLALGGLLKGTITLTRGEQAFVSQHLGDLDRPANLGFLRETIDHLQRMLAVEPVIIAHDAHPDFPTTRLADESGLPTLAVQHHHAHVAAVAAEQGLTGPILGLVLDGYGRGSDGGAWGGEILRLTGTECQRLGHLRPLALPGGDRAAREPWRMAAGLLHDLGRGESIAHRFVGQPLAPALADLLAGGKVGRTSSAGRLFDAVAGVLGICAVQSHEAEAAMALEALVRQPRILADGWIIQDGQLDLTPLLRGLALPGFDPVAGAELFHGTFAAALADWLAGFYQGEALVLTGGCCLNIPLMTSLLEQLRARGLHPHLARAVPPNDGGLSLGQAWIAGLTHLAREKR